MTDMHDPIHNPREIELLLRNYRLTTAEILYHLPDYPKLLQSYVWQELDLAPKFPVLKGFLEFWERDLEGKIHSVKVDAMKLIAPSEVRFGKGEWQIH